MPNLYLSKFGTLAVGLGSSLNTRTTPTRVLNASTQGFNRINPKARWLGRKGRPSAGGQSYRTRSISDTTTVPISGELDLNDFILPLLTGVGDTPTITQVSGTSTTYRWVYNPSGSVIQTPMYATIEYREKTPNTSAQYNVYDAHKGFCESFSLSAQGMDLVTMNSNYQLGMRRQKDNRTMDGTDELPSEDIVSVPVKLCTMGIWDSWDDMIAGEPGATDTLQYNVNYQTGFKPLQRRDGVLDYERVEADMRGMQVSAVVYSEHGTDALARIEDEKRENDLVRFVKMRFKSTEATEDTQRFRIGQNAASEPGTPSGGSVSGDVLTPPAGWSATTKPSGSDTNYYSNVYVSTGGTLNYSAVYTSSDDLDVGLIEDELRYFLDIGMAAHHTDNSLQQRGQTTDGDFLSLAMDFDLTYDETEDREVYFELQTSKEDIDAYQNPS